MKNTSLPSLGQLLRRSKIIQGLGRAIQNKFIQSGKKPPIGDYANYGQRVQAQFSESEKVEPLLATLSEMVEVSNQSNIPFVIVLFPLLTQYLGDDRKPQELVRQTVEGAGGIVIDLYDSLEKAGGAMAYVPNDPVHPHDQGHHAVAAEIAAALKAQILSKASADTSVSTS
ncbi:MAG: hypothetical protein JKX97_02185 [Candidatus Lindowbacteria bacterium]|nr:hypothetical protein [Candidatus Lindowbacteria bacterium]